MHRKCLKEHFANVKHSINVAIITLRKTFGLTKAFENLYMFTEKRETCKLDYGISSG